MPEPQIKARDEFAMAALIGILAGRDEKQVKAANRQGACELAYKYADEMLQVKEDTE